jgi:rod shape-determining protein MreC
LLINDQTSGVGVILERTRVHGVLRGTASGGLAVEKVLNDEDVQPGERIITSGGDQIFPKGLAVGVVSRVSPGSNSFLNIEVKPAARLSKLEEVLVVTKVEDRAPAAESTGSMRAVDVLTRRLPSVPDTPAGNPPSPAPVGPKPSGSTPEPRAQASGVAVNVPANANGAQTSLKPGTSQDAANSGSPRNPASSGATGSVKTPSLPKATGANSGSSGIPVIAKPVSTDSAIPSAPKPATAVSKSAEKSAKPGPTQPAPVEDNPQ